MKLLLKLFPFLLLSIACKNNTEVPPLLNSKLKTEIKPTYAKGFSVFKGENYIKIAIYTPWPGAKDTLTHYLFSKNETIPKGLKNESIIRTPINKIISCSTVDIPLLEAINMEHTLIGFPEHKYISSNKTRKLIDNDSVKDIGSLQHLNTEMILDLNPDLIVGFSSNSDNKTFNLLERSGIQTLMNGSWLETHPLGRAEWIKVYGLLFNKEKEAETYFNNIAQSYNQALNLVKNITNKPKVLSGNMYKDVWYVPGGNSYAAKLIADARGDYFWKENAETGSLAFSFESVYEKAEKASVWIGGGNYSSYKELINRENKYNLFDVVKQKNVYSKDLKKGQTGGILYYEQGSLHADWILKDLIKIFHPNLVPNYNMHFYQKLN